MKRMDAIAACVLLVAAPAPAPALEAPEPPTAAAIPEQTRMEPRDRVRKALLAASRRADDGGAPASPVGSTLIPLEASDFDALARDTDLGPFVAAAVEQGAGALVVLLPVRGGPQAFLFTGRRVFGWVGLDDAVDGKRTVYQPLEDVKLEGPPKHALQPAALYGDDGRTVHAFRVTRVRKRGRVPR